MAGTAWLFPGHGSQYVGMGRGYPFEAQPVRAVFEEAEHCSGERLRHLAVDGSAAELRDPRVLEPLLAAFSLANAALLSSRGRDAQAVLGYSAGTVAALCCAGVISRSAALRIAAQRGRLLHDGATTCQGGMAAAVGLDAAAVCAAITPWAALVDVAGWNAPDHLTLVGDSAALAQAGTAVAAQGGTWLPVDVAGAWHCSRAAALAEQARALHAAEPFLAPRIAFYCSVSAVRLSDPQQMRESLSVQLRRPVLWAAALGRLRAAEGISEFIEVGCGRILQGITRRNATSIGSAPVRFSGVHSLA